MNTPTPDPRPPTVLGPTLALAALLPLAACGTMTSPLWGDTFPATATPVPLKAMTLAFRPVDFQCARASTAGTLPLGGPATWHPVATVGTGQTLTSGDGQQINNPGVTLILPPQCWHLDTTATPPIYRSAVRARQAGPNGSPETFRVLDNAGEACLMSEYVATGTYTEAYAAACHLTHPGSNTPVGYALIQALAETPSWQPPAYPIQIGRFPLAEADMLAAFNAEPVDADWAPMMERRLRQAIAEASDGATQLQALACRRTICQVDLQHGDAAAAARFGLAIGPKRVFVPGGEFGESYPARAARGVRGVHYIARDGHRLPQGKGR